MKTPITPICASFLLLSFLVINPLKGEVLPYAITELQARYEFNPIYRSILDLDEDRLKEGANNGGMVAVLSNAFLARQGGVREEEYLEKAIELGERIDFDRDTLAYLNFELADYFLGIKRKSEGLFYSLKCVNLSTPNSLVYWLGYLVNSSTLLDQSGQEAAIESIYLDEIKPFLTPKEQIVALVFSLPYLDLKLIRQELEELESIVPIVCDLDLEYAYWGARIILMRHPTQVEPPQLNLIEKTLRSYLRRESCTLLMRLNVYNSLATLKRKNREYIAAAALYDTLVFLLPDNVPHWASSDLRWEINKNIYLGNRANTIVYLSSVGRGIEPVEEAFEIKEEKVNFYCKFLPEVLDVWDASNFIENSGVSVKNALVISAYLYDETCEEEYLETALNMASTISSVIPLSQMRDQVNIEAGGRLGELVNTKQNADRIWHESMSKLKPGDIDIDFDYLFSLLEAKNDAREAIIEYAPDYYRENIYNGWSLDIGELQEELGRNNRSLLYIYKGGPVFYRYYFDGDDLFFLPEYIYDGSLATRTEVYNRLVNAVELTDLEKDTLESVSRELYQSLFAELEPFMSDEIDIIVDGELKRVALEALRVDTVGDTPQYFGDSHSINYHSSFQLREIAMEKEANYRRNQVYALAPSFDAPVLYNNRDGSTRKANSLSNNREEVEYISTLLPGEYVFDESAKRSLFDQNVADYSVLHLATHAEANSSDGRMSRIYFYGDTDDDSNLLYAGEMPTYSINAEMVVLSACETGAGSYNSTQGLVGLTQAFLAAGAKSVVSTRWAVDDRATAEIMASFYTNLKEGLPKDQSLQLAQRDYRQRHAGTDKALPFYWAAFELTGDPSPLEFRSDFYYDWWKWLLCGGIGLGALLLLRSQLHKRA